MIFLFWSEFYFKESTLSEDSEQNSAVTPLSYEHSVRNCHEIKHSFPKNLGFSVLTQQYTYETTSLLVGQKRNLVVRLYLEHLEIDVGGELKMSHDWASPISHNAKELPTAPAWGLSFLLKESGSCMRSALQCGTEPVQIQHGGPILEGTVSFPSH